MKHVRSLEDAIAGIRRDVAQADRQAEEAVRRLERTRSFADAILRVKVHIRSTSPAKIAAYLADRPLAHCPYCTEERPFIAIDGLERVVCHECTAAEPLQATLAQGQPTFSQGDGPEDVVQFADAVASLAAAVLDCN